MPPPHPAGGDPRPHALVALALRIGLDVRDPDVGLLLQTGSGEIVDATPEAQAVLGLDLGQLTGRTPQVSRWVAVHQDGGLVAPEDHPSVRALRTGAPVLDAVLGIHRPARDAAGRHVWLSVTSVPVAVPGHPADGGVLTTLSEVTGHQGRDLQVAESERMFRILTESALEMVAWQLPDSTFLWVSPAAQRLLGRSPAELVGTRAHALMDATGVAAEEAREEAAAAGLPVPDTQTVRLTHADGRDVWVDVSRRVLATSQGRATELRTAWRDVTARVQAEAERDAALRLVRSALQHSPIGFALRAVGGVVVQANAALGSMLGRRPGEVVERTLADFADPRDRTDDDVDGERELLAGRTAVHESERRYVRGDGGVVWGHCTSVLLHDETGVPRHVLVHLQDITDRKSAVDQLARTALTDPLTGLVNRAVFTERLTRSLEHRHVGGSRVGVLFVDLDHFKPVNDALGHDVGDEVLRQTANRISLAVRHQDLVARLGGDEFVVLCPDVPDPVDGSDDVLADIAGRVVEAVAAPFRIAGHEVLVSASVGVTVADRRRGARDVLAAADAAMYEAKRAGRGRFAMTAEALETVALDELDLDADLARGIAAGELRLVHQPIVHAPEGRVVAREALVRWQHPTRGLLGPGAFVAAAERSPLVVTLGTWVLHQACREAVQWEDAVPVHVNVSASHLALTDFADTVARTLATTGLPAHRLRLEITETLALTGSASTLRSIAALAALGVGIQLDDFGTGCSSISALHQIPVTGLKIDISFVQDLGTPATAALVDGLIHLARGMGLDVVAEGVEDTVQASWLVAHGCPLQQGDLHGRPSTVGSADLTAVHPPTAPEDRP